MGELWVCTYPLRQMRSTERIEWIACTAGSRKHPEEALYRKGRMLKKKELPLNAQNWREVAREDRRVDFGQ